MVNRIRKAIDERDQGFTLIELLVVIIIIGILAAIAIPVFLNQRKKGVDASLKSDLKSAATSVETWITDNPQSQVVPGTDTSITLAAGGSGADDTALEDFRASEGNVVTLAESAGTTGAYCVFAYNANASDDYNAAGRQMAYKSQEGGLVGAVTATTCT